jgi:hypothetical protein
MPKPVAQTDIVNAAAALVGSSERVQSIDGAGNLASHARAHWDIVLRRLLADHPWNPFIRRRPLNAAAVAPAFGFERAFALPEDCLRVLLPRSDDVDDYFEGEIEGRLIYSDADAPIFIRYISGDLADDTGRWPPHFAEAMTWALAAMLAEPLTGSESIARRLMDGAADALARAKRVDGLETAPRDRQQVSRRSRWLAGYQGVPYSVYSR